MTGTRAEHSRRIPISSHLSHRATSRWTTTTSSLQKSKFNKHQSTILHLPRRWRQVGGARRPSPTECGAELFLCRRKRRRRAPPRMEQSSHPPQAAAERAALRSARSFARADGSSGSAGCGAELFLCRRKRKSSDPGGCFEFWWARRPPSLIYDCANRVPRLGRL